MDQQAIEQGGVGSGTDRQMQIGFRRRCGAPGIDHHHARAAAGAIGDHALEQHRVTPSDIGTHQNDQIGEVEILLASGHQIRAEARR